MSILDRVKRGTIAAPYKAVIHGVEGVGKSTFAADSESPLFLCSEDGTEHLDVDRVPEPGSWAAVIELIVALKEEKHDYKTLVIDTLDWLEPLAADKVCKANGWKNLDTPGYGKGPNAALQEWRVLLRGLESVRKGRGMNILLLAHTEIKTFRNPDGEDYDRYQMKLQPKAAGLVREWADAVLFADFETVTTSTGGRAKGITTGARILHTERRAAWEAKNRYSLPPHMPLSFADFDAARRTPSDRSEELHALLAKAPDDLRVTVTDWIESQPNKRAAIAQAIDRLNARLAIDGDDSKEETES